MAVGSGIRGKGGAVLLYHSKDLRHWEYLHLLAEGSASSAAAANPVDSGDMWECPDFFALGQKHVLIHSTKGKAYWQSGTFDSSALVFHAERGGVLDYGSYYAPKTQVDQAGNRILWGWITEARPEAEYHAAGWAGMMSLPRLLSLDDRGELRIGVADQVERLRGREQRLQISGNDAALRQQLATIRVEDCCGEIRCAFRRGKAPVDIALATPEGDGPAWLTCRYDPAHAGEIVIDGQRVPLGDSDGAEAELRFYIDGSVIECFANGYGALTKRFYVSGRSAPTIGVRVNEGLGSFTGLSMWQISPISRDRLTT
jgi:beta-fructofuranosidase